MFTVIRETRNLVQFIYMSNKQFENINKAMTIIWLVNLCIKVIFKTEL